MRFDIIWRVVSGDTVLATVTYTFDPVAAGSSTVLFDADLPAPAVPAAPGDLLVLRFSTVGGAADTYYAPNGDGSLAGGRDPNLTLPH